MKLHEYQAKQLFADAGLPVAQYRVVKTADDAAKAYAELGTNICAVKAQVHAGGRGKAGGVKLAKSADEARQIAEDMLGSRLVTIQTDAHGLPVNELVVEAGQDIGSEFYLSALVDRSSERIVFMASAAGGVNIEEVAEKTPEKIIATSVHPAVGLQGWQVRKLGFGLGLNKEQLGEFDTIMRGIYHLFAERDASLVEINPLVILGNGSLLALDAKLNIDDNASYRQKDIVEMLDTSQEDPRELEAAGHGLNYVSLDGEIGCMVNGAGLAMGTMDLINHYGGKPANFLDVGGGATAERVTAAFKLILSDDAVKAVLVNIFGGIVRCDLIAEGIIQAVREVDVDVPVIVRLEGTNVDKGRALLADCGLAITPANDLADAAQKAVDAAK